MIPTRSSKKPAIPQFIVYQYEQSGQNVLFLNTPTAKISRK
jgi:hypothetical protein